MAEHTRGHFALQLTDSERDRRAQVSACRSHDPDVYDWTEAQTDDLVDAIEALPGVDTFWPVRVDGRPVVHPKNFAPFSWVADRFRLVPGTGRAEFASDGVGGKFPDKWFCRGTLEDLRTGERFDVVSGHMVPGIQSLDDETARVAQLTREAHAKNVRVYSALMLEGGRPTIGGTDANDTRFPSKVAAGITCTDVGPTHRSGREIDFITVAGGAVIVSARTVPIGPSDHLGVIAGVRTPSKETPVAYQRITWAPAVLRAAGLTVIEHDGWENRGLPTSRRFEPVAVVWHHDASAPGDSPSVPQSMINQFSIAAAQLWVDRVGRWHIIASGRAPHAGAVLPGKPGNEDSIGVETDHTTGESWPPELLASLRKGTAALLTHMGKTSVALEFHKTICDPPGRKVDPDGLSLSTERARVGNLIVPAVKPAPKPGKTPRADELVRLIYGAMGLTRAALADPGVLARHKIVYRAVLWFLREAARATKTISTKH